MSLVRLAIRITRRTLDALLVLLIALVLATVVIARVIPALTGGQAFVVGGGSMEPTLPLGSAVIAMPVHPADLRVGDVVTLRVGPQHAVFTHRITRLVDHDGALWIATRGDANPGPDPSLVPAAAVLGRVDWGIPYAGYLIALLGSASGVTLVVALAGMLLAGAWLLETFEEHPRARRRSASGLAPGTAG